METYERKNRIAEALRVRNTTQVKLCEMTGIKKSALSSWIKQRWQPKQTPLHLMAQALDVSEMWLAGYDVAMERPTSQKKMDDLAEVVQKLKNNERYFNLVNEILNLKDEQMVLIEAMIKQFNHFE